MLKKKNWVKTVSLNIANQKLIAEVYELLIKEVGVKRRERRNERIYKGSGKRKILYL